MQTAEQVAAEKGHTNDDSNTTLETVTIDDIEYELRVCGAGKSAYFELIDDGGDPVGDVFDTLPTSAEQMLLERLLPDTI